MAQTIPPNPSLQPNPTPLSASFQPTNSPPQPRYPPYPNNIHPPRSSSANKYQFQVSPPPNHPSSSHIHLQVPGAHQAPPPHPNMNTQVVYPNASHNNFTKV